MSLAVPFGWSEFWAKAGEQMPSLRVGARLAHMGWVQATWLMDEVLAPGWRESELKGPVFVLGHQRSGTTAIHRALSAQPEMSGCTLSEMLFPAICTRMLGRFGSAVDQLLGGTPHRWLGRLQDRYFAELDPIHRIRLDEVEEDEFFFWTLFASGMCANDGPESMASERLSHLRDPGRWLPERREQVWAWYRSCLEKHAHMHRDDEIESWVVSKNPAFCKRIPELMSNFPLAKFVILHRNPLETIPSRLNLVQQIWNSRSQGAQRLRASNIELLYQDSLEIYRCLERDLNRIPEDRLISLATEDVARDLDGVLERISDDLGLPAPQVCMSSTLRRGRASTTTLAKFGLNEDRIRSDLAPVFNSRRWSSV